MRIRLTDGTGRYFDKAKATEYEEGSRWDGHNNVSLHTGSQWEHEALYRTAKGLWILHWWSQWQGTRATYEEIPPERAQRWLSIAGEDQALAEHFPEHGDLEI